MKRFFILCLLLLAVVTPSQAQDHGFSLVPACAQSCVKDFLKIPTCDAQSASFLPCACKNSTALSQARQCFTVGCTPKEVLTALNATSVACDEPIRNKWKSYRIIHVVFFSLALTAIAIRWTTHAAFGHIQWIHECNMVVVLALNIGLFVVCYKMTFTGLGQDLWKVSFPDITYTLYLFWISECTYFALITFVKLQFLLFYLQIFPDPRFRRIVSCVIAFSLASMVAFILSCIFLCSPISLAWTQWDGEHTGKCNDNNALSYANASISILLDLVALYLPIPQIWRLQLSYKKKIGVLLMFGVGAFVTIVSVLRLRAFTYFAKTTNVTWDFTEASLWSIIEWEVGIICSCMPAIRLSLVRLFPTILGSTAHSTYKDTHATGVGRSGGGTLQGLGSGGISAKTTFRVSSHMRKTQSSENEEGFMQLVEIGGGANSAAASTRSLTGESRETRHH
ncbi:hypothetical protein FB567DRAFT_538441 [Paraphoma chrysanthemicola]|uniref:Extracellular membrane protein CFEM domain-containing protein n=1 Tax=Paraphoma chrysanthemicola TaxID=798071 RepID=A0A8K0QWH9_9PLEO|nr:hypothetical protein FB567DRAFT_538441 [Paraphoma chrysanthemicola]